MSGIPRRLFLASAAVVASLGAAAALPRPVKRHAPFDLETVIPRQFGDWQIDPSVVPVTPSPDVEAQLESLYEQTLGRTYVNAARDRVMLSIAYGGDQRDALRSHRPDVCYRAQGFTVNSIATAPANVNGREIPVTRMHTVMGRRSEPVTFWMTMGNDVITGRAGRLVAQLSVGLTEGVIPDGMVVRVSTIDADVQRAYAVHDRFVHELLASMPPQAAARLTGR